jgi:hypothetical protein
VFDHNTMSGRSAVGTISGKTSFFPRSAAMSQVVAWSKIDDTCVRCFVAGSPSLINWIFLVVLTVLFLRLSCSKMSASSRRTQSCLHVYLP